MRAHMFTLLRLNGGKKIHKMKWHYGNKINFIFLFISIRNNVMNCL